MACNANLKISRKQQNTGLDKLEIYGLEYLADRA
jgi:hypothetical protein